MNYNDMVFVVKCFYFFWLPVFTERHGGISRNYDGSSDFVM